MTLDDLILWHRDQAERYERLARESRARLPQPYKESLKRSNERHAAFHEAAARVLLETKKPAM